MRLSILVCFAAGVSTVRAQVSPAVASHLPDTLGSPRGPVARRQLGRNTTVLMTTALGAGVAVSRFDSRLLSFTNSVTNGGHLRRSSAVGAVIGGPGPISLGMALYALGKGSGHTFLSNMGREVTRAVLYSGSVTALVKGAVGRARPFASPGDADEYAPGHGFLDTKRSSFPSGHTSAAFAAATVLARELGTSHPASRSVVSPLLFGAASFVGWSRVYDHQHWPSDVLIGAALGSITGYEVVAHARGDRSRLSGAFLSHLRLRPSRHELDVGWSLR